MNVGVIVSCFTRAKSIYALTASATATHLHPALCLESITVYGLHRASDVTNNVTNDFCVDTDDDTFLLAAAAACVTVI